MPVVLDDEDEHVLVEGCVADKTCTREASCELKIKALDEYDRPVGIESFWVCQVHGKEIAMDAVNAQARRPIPVEDEDDFWHDY